VETTVVKGLKVLEALAASDGPCALGDVAVACGMTKSNAHRLLKTLEDCRYVRQDPQSKAYELTLRVWELGIRVFNRLDLRSAAAPHLRALAKATKESVHLSIFDEPEVVYVAKVDSSHAVRAYIEVGDRAPAYCVATGKAMLAFMPDDVIEACCRGMKRYTSRTVTDPRELKAELAGIRERGYAVTHGEWRGGVLGYAAPLLSPSGAVIAGLGIAGPEERMRAADPESQAAAVRKAAAAIVRDLGLGQARPAVRAEAAVPPRARPAARRSRAAAARG
jgi:DNA-binding IclR family transcriptional regulator